MLRPGAFRMPGLSSQAGGRVATSAATPMPDGVRKDAGHCYFPDASVLLRGDPPQKSLSLSD